MPARGARALGEDWGECVKSAKNPAAQALGRLGGLARAKALSEERRLTIAQQAAKMKAKRAKIQRALSGKEA